MSQIVLRIAELSVRLLCIKSSKLQVNFSLRMKCTCAMISCNPPSVRIISLSFCVPGIKVSPRCITSRREAVGRVALAGETKRRLWQGVLYNSKSVNYQGLLAFGLVEIIPAEDDYCDTNARQLVSRRRQLH